MSLDMWIKRSHTRSKKNDDDIIEEVAPSTSQATECSSKRAREKSESTAKAAKKRKLNNRWLEEFPWVEFKEGKMFCKLCIRASDGCKKLRDNMNKFVLGSTNLQRSALVRHLQCDDHKLSAMVLENKQAMENFQEKQVLVDTDSLTAQISTAVTMAVEDIPDTKFIPLLQLQKQNGAPSLQDDQKWYRRNESCKEMQAAAAEVCHERVRQRLNDSPFIGLMVDESIDIATNKKLVITLKILVDGEPQIQFGTNCEVQNGKAATIVAAIREYLASVAVPLDKIVGIGTDGANVMIGCKNGVTTVLQRLNPSLVGVWCCAHRLSLVAHWAASGVPALKKLQDTLVTIYNYFKYSAVRNNSLKQLKQVMEEKVKRFKKPTAVRWLSLDEAVRAAEESWGCLCLTLENAATEKDATAAALLKEVKTYKFVATLCLLRDVLDPLMKTSLIYQKDQLDIQQSTKALKSMLDYIQSLATVEGPHLAGLHRSLDDEGGYQGIQFQAGNAQRANTKTTCQKFVENIQTQANKRFPAEDMGKLKALDYVFNPEHLPVPVEEMVAYGEQHIPTLVEAFPQVDEQRLRGDYRQFKFFLHNHRGDTLQSICIRVAKNHHQQFPDFATLAQISLVLPLTSVPCERAFSLQNSLMNSKRNRMGLAHLNNKMAICCERRMAQKKGQALEYPMPPAFTDQAVRVYKTIAKRKK